MNLLTHIETLIFKLIDSGYCKAETEPFHEYTRSIVATKKGFKVIPNVKPRNLANVEDFTGRLNELPDGKHEGVLVGMRVHKKRHKFEDIEELVLIYK